MEDKNETTPRTVIHDATLSVYDPDTLPDFDVFSAVVDLSAETITQEVDA